MARNDGIDRTFARNQDLPTLDDVAKVQEHNEREKDSYSNQDIDTTQTYRNVHFKAPTDSYAAMFDQMIADGVISTRGLKADAVKYGELIFDVNSAYFHNHGGYEYAKQFYTDAYKAAVEIVGGEQYILSAVMHADERNRAMSEALGQDVYHYHLHVVYVPVVEKQILWSKRCKDMVETPSFPFRNVTFSDVIYFFLFCMNFAIYFSVPVNQPSDGTSESLFHLLPSRSLHPDHAAFHPDSHIHAQYNRYRPR